MYDLMVDIETLATGKYALVLQVAAVKFLPEESGIRGEDARCWNLKWAGVQKGREVDSMTVFWWNTQDAEVRDRVFSQMMAVHAGEMFDQLVPMIDGARQLWARSPDFDYPILFSLLDDVRAETGSALDEA